LTSRYNPLATLGTTSALNGQRVLMLKAAETAGAFGIVMVQNWFTELKSRVPLSK